jgi:hypothetical protein
MIFAHPCAPGKRNCRDVVADNTGSGFGQREASDDERIHAGTKIAAHRIARRNNQRLAEQVERCIHQHRRPGATSVPHTHSDVFLFAQTHHLRRVSVFEDVDFPASATSIYIELKMEILAK